MTNKNDKLERLIIPNANLIFWDEYVRGIDATNYQSILNGDYISRKVDVTKPYNIQFIAGEFRVYYVTNTQELFMEVRTTCGEVTHRNIGKESEYSDPVFNEYRIYDPFIWEAEIGKKTHYSAVHTLKLVPFLGFSFSGKSNFVLKEYLTLERRRQIANKIKQNIKELERTK